MKSKQDGERIYLCPMHRDVRQPGGGTCPKCGMDLIPEGARFGLLRHIGSHITNHPMLAVGMAAAMLALMIAANHF